MKGQAIPEPLEPQPYDPWQKYCRQKEDRCRLAGDSELAEHYAVLRQYTSRAVFTPDRCSMDIFTFTTLPDGIPLIPLTVLEIARFLDAKNTGESIPVDLDLTVTNEFSHCTRYELRTPGTPSIQEAYAAVSAASVSVCTPPDKQIPSAVIRVEEPLIHIPTRDVGPWYTYLTLMHTRCVPGNEDSLARALKAAAVSTGHPAPLGPGWTVDVYSPDDDYGLPILAATFMDAYVEHIGLQRALFFRITDHCPSGCRTLLVDVPDGTTFGDFEEALLAARHLCHRKPDAPLTYSVTATEHRVSDSIPSDTPSRLPPRGKGPWYDYLLLTEIRCTEDGMRNLAGALQHLAALTTLPEPNDSGWAITVHSLDETTGALVVLAATFLDAYLEGSGLDPAPVFTITNYDPLGCRVFTVNVPRAKEMQDFEAAVIAATISPCP